MKHLTMACLIVFLAVTVCAAEEPVLKTEKEKVSYIIGTGLGRDLKRQGIDVDSDVLAKGLKDALAGAQPAITDQDAQETMKVFRQEMTAKKQAKTKKAAEENKKQEDAFLAENAKKEGVRTLPSGLQYKVLKEGSGEKPTLNDTVTVNYRGTLINGTEFDSSYKRNQPATFPVKGVIRGWTEALQTMKVGSKWQLFIPAKLAYGEAGAGEQIPPNAMLIFEVELLSINPPSGAAAGGPGNPDKPVQKEADKPASQSPAK
jgi:FKBP-type peptidyl-prolyl cis-trans isomerase FklB